MLLSIHTAGVFSPLHFSGFNICHSIYVTIRMNYNLDIAVYFPLLIFLYWLSSNYFRLLKLAFSSKLALNLWAACLVCGWTSANLLINPTITPWNFLFFPQKFWNKTLFFHFSSYLSGLRRKLHKNSSGTTAEKNKSECSHSFAICWKKILEHMWKWWRSSTLFAQ